MANASDAPPRAPGETTRRFAANARAAVGQARGAGFIVGVKTGKSEIRAYRRLVALSPFLSVDSPPPAVTSDEPETGIIGPIGRLGQLREWALVLSSMGIAHAVRDTGNGWLILVSGSDVRRAQDAIRLYEAENRNWPPRRTREKLPHARSLAAPFLMLLLFLFFTITGPASQSSEWFARGTASSDRILHGEWWRTVTALTLHADTLHVLGNALTGSIFLSAVNRRLGDGRGPLVVVLAGALGNFLNAAWHRTGHLSIGASTAVFAAVGVLVATQLALDRSEGSRPWLERAAPLVGGLALLGMLGASPHSDLLAHLFGLLAGLVVGLVASLLVGLSRRRAETLPASEKAAGINWKSTAGQLAAALATGGIVAGSWGLAFAAH